jgi:hypothetical protein
MAIEDIVGEWLFFVKEMLFNRDIVESRVWVKKGKRRRILLLEKTQQPHIGARKERHPCDRLRRIRLGIQGLEPR